MYQIDMYQVCISSFRYQRADVEITFCSTALYFSVCAAEPKKKKKVIIASCVLFTFTTAKRSLSILTR